MVGTDKHWASEAKSQPCRNGASQVRHCGCTREGTVVKLSGTGLLVSAVQPLSESKRVCSRAIINKAMQVKMLYLSAAFAHGSRRRTPVQLEP